MPENCVSEIVSPTGQPSQRGEWTWELAILFPRQGAWPEEEYLSREFEERVEYTYGMLDFIDPLYPRGEGPPASGRGDWTWEMLIEFPRQGSWKQRHVDLLPDNIQQQVKLVDGCLEFPSPSEWIGLIPDWPVLPKFDQPDRPKAQ